jgi:chitin synthase
MVKGKDGLNMVSMELTDRKNINTNYENFVTDLVGPRPKAVQPGPKLTQDDYFRKYRTTLLLSWFFTNGLIIVAFTNVKLSRLIYNWFGVSEDESFHPYLRFLFYTVAVISSIRFLGSMTYIIFYILLCC